jgi:hypothetical protein
MSKRNWYFAAQLFLLPYLPVCGAPREFVLQEQIEEAPETGRFASYVLLAGEDQFRFVPPLGWRVTAEASQARLVLVAPGGVPGICLSVRPPSKALAPGADPNGLREEVLRRFPGARIVEEFACYTSGQAGRGFELQWSVGEALMASRVAYFSTLHGSLEFSLSTSASRMRTSRAALGALLTSFQTVSPPRQ